MWMYRSNCSLRNHSIQAVSDPYRQQNGREREEKIPANRRRPEPAQSMTGDDDDIGREKIALEVCPETVRRPSAEGAVNHDRGAVGVVCAAQDAREEAEGISRPFLFQLEQPRAEEAVEGKSDDDQGEDDLSRVFVRPFEKEKPEGDSRKRADQ